MYMVHSCPRLDKPVRIGEGQFSEKGEGLIIDGLRGFPKWV